MSVGGNHGKVLAIDGISRKNLFTMYNKHGLKIVTDALNQCGGASRPVAMAKSIIKKGIGNAGQSVPTADEWRTG